MVNTTHDRKHADTLLEAYVTTVIPEILTVFFNSPFSEASTTIKVMYEERLVDKNVVTKTIKKYNIIRSNEKVRTHISDLSMLVVTLIISLGSQLEVYKLSRFVIVCSISFQVKLSSLKRNIFRMILLLPKQI